MTQSEVIELMIFAYRKGYEDSTKVLGEVCAAMTDMVDAEELKRVFSKVLQQHREQRH